MMVNASASRSRGVRYIQNFDQSRVLIDMGELRISQKALPSRLTAGKTKRMATAETTKAASPIFKKE